MNKVIISVDTETSSLNPQEAELVGISLSYDLIILFIFRLGHKNIKVFR